MAVASSNTDTESGPDHMVPCLAATISAQFRIRDNGSAASVQGLEAQLSTAEVAECRWRAWAQEMAGSKSPLHKEVQLLTHPCMLYAGRDLCRPVKTCYCQ